MSVYYADPAAGTNVPIKSRTEGGQHILARDIERLPGTVEDDIAESRGYLEQLANTIASSRIAVDLSGTVAGYLQSLAGSIAAGRIQSDILSLPGTVATDINTLAGAITSGSMRAVLQAGSAVIGKLAANVGVNIGTVDVASAILAQLPTVIGQTTKAASLSVALASNQDALPVTDNGGSLTVDGTVSVSGTVATSATQLPSGLGQTTMNAALPVAIASDQSAVPVTVSDADTTASGSVLAVNSAVSIALAGKTGVAVQCAAISSGSTLVPEISFDGGTNWQLTSFYDPATASFAASVTLGSAISRALVIPGGASHARVRISVNGGGSPATATLRATRVAGPMLISAPALPASIGTKTKALSLGVTIASDDPLVVDPYSTTGIFSASGSTASVSLSGRSSVIFSATVGSFIGTLVPEYTTTLLGVYSATYFVDPTTGATSTTLAFTNPNTDITRAIFVPPGAATVRVRVSAYTSGTLNFGLGASNANFSNIFSWFGSQAPTVGRKVMASSLPVTIASDDPLVTAQSPPTANYGGQDDSHHRRDSRRARGFTSVDGGRLGASTRCQYRARLRRHVKRELNGRRHTARGQGVAVHSHQQSRQRLHRCRSQWRGRDVPGLVSGPHADLR